MDEKGYIQFENRWIKGPPPEASLLMGINHVRTRCFDEGLIGVEASGVGFGNVSVRIQGTCRFVVSGTQTGAIRSLGARQYTKVVDSCIERNRVVAVGPIAASSESLSHAAAYVASGRVAAVIHVHSKILWDRLRGVIPTTDRRAEAGTPEMAREIGRLVSAWTGQAGVIAMGGHRDGLLAFGAGPDSAVEALFALR